MHSFLKYLALPASLQRLLYDVDGRGTYLGGFLFLADLLVLRDGGCLILVLPPPAGLAIGRAPTRCDSPW